MRIVMASLGVALIAAAIGSTTLLGRGKQYTVEDLSWLSGHWVATHGDLRFDDVYSEPRNGSIMGMFRVVQDDVVRTYGIMSFSDTEDGVLYRYRRMTPDLAPLEKLGHVIERPLLRIKGKTAIFKDMRIELINRNKMHLSLELTHVDGSTEQSKVVFYRPCAGVCMMP